MRLFFIALAIVLGLLVSETIGAPSEFTSRNKDVQVLVFKSETCGPCRRDAKKVKLMRKRGVNVREIDVDKHPEVAKQYGVEKLPTYVVERNGVEIKRARGILTILAFLGWLLGLIF